MVRNLGFERSKSDIDYGFGDVVQDNAPKGFLKKNENNLILVDQIAAKEFSLNNFGWPRNTMSNLANMQSAQQAIATYQMMQKNAPIYNLKEGFNVEDAFNQIRPRQCQMPTELMQFAEHIAKGDMKKLNDAYDKAYMDYMNKQEKKEDIKPAES